MIVNDKIVKVQVWDTAGQERYRSITNAYYRGAEAIMIIFDLTNKESFKSIKNWMEEVIKYTGPEVKFIIGGNKSDLPNKTVSSQDIEEFKKKYNLNVFEISAKTGEGVEDAFKFMVQELIKSTDEKKQERGKKVNLNEGGNNGKNGCCGN